MEAKVSIVVPCYNGEKYIVRFLESILGQTYDNLLLILVNDGSNDHTEEIVLEYKDKLNKGGKELIYLKQENQGQAAALNTGLKMIKGEYLLWMDSDDEISENFIETRVQFLESHKEYAFCYGNVEFIKDDESKKVLQVLEERSLISKEQFLENVLYAKNMFFTGYVVRVSAIERILKNGDIYTGRGGQNAQLLIPLVWYYEIPGYVNEGVYRYYVRDSSHSHSKNTSEKIIRQLENYEEIVVQTLKKISDKKSENYIKLVKHYYARLCFGNAVDTKNRILIQRYFKKLRKDGTATKKEWMLWFKYSNFLVRRLLRI